MSAPGSEQERNRKKVSISCPRLCSQPTMKFADDAGRSVVVITKNDEKAYVDEVELLSQCCQDHNLLLKINKTKEQAVKFRVKQQRSFTALTSISSFTFTSARTCLDSTHFICSTEGDATTPFIMSLHRASSLGTSPGQELQC